MKKTIITLCLVLLVGCVDMGRVGMHPEMKTAYFDGRPYQAEACLTAAALDQRLYLEKDDPLPNDTKRFNLVQDNETVAWVEITAFGHRQTSATFYYNRTASDIRASVSAMIAECKTLR